jgi:pyrroline-5-carboxylate reductase
MSTRVGIIGTGNMGQAMVRGWSRAGGFDLAGIDLNRENLEKLGRETGMRVLDSVQELARTSDYLIAAVKPRHMGATLASVRDHTRETTCLISIAAGLRLESLQEMIGRACPVVRVMPNTPALVGKGVFALCFDDPGLAEGHKETAASLFKALGQVHVLEEAAFDAFTALAGSGPAYVFYIMEALVEAGVAGGLSRAQATDMTKALLTGSSALAEESGHSLTALREMVTSPGGTTITALNHLDRNAVRGAIIDAVLAALDKSESMGRK